MKKPMLFVLPFIAFAAPAAAEVPGGFRLEGMVGYERTQARFPDAATAGTGERKTVNGVAYGLGAGFDFPMNPVLAVGADAELTFSSSDKSTFGGELSLQEDMYVGGRITGSVGELVNAYAKVGYTNLDVNFRRLTATAVEPNLEGRLNGVRGAIGVQIMSDDETRTFFGIEGRYSNYERGLTRQQIMLTLGARL